MSMRRAAVLSALWAAGETWSLRGVSMIVFLVLARLVEPAAFGLVALAAVYVTTMSTLTDQGLTTALIQRDTIEQAHKDSAFWANLAVGIALGLITLAVAGPIANLYGEPRLAPILRWFSLAPLLASASIVQVVAAAPGLALSRSGAAPARRRHRRWRHRHRHGVCRAWGSGRSSPNLSSARQCRWRFSGPSPIGARPSLFPLRHFRDLFSFGLNVLAANVRARDRFPGRPAGAGLFPGDDRARLLQHRPAAARHRHGFRRRQRRAYRRSAVRAHPGR